MCTPNMYPNVCTCFQSFYLKVCKNPCTIDDDVGDLSHNVSVVYCIPSKQFTPRKWQKEAEMWDTSFSRWGGSRRGFATHSQSNARSCSLNIVTDVTQVLSYVSFFYFLFYTNIHSYKGCSLRNSHLSPISRPIKLLIFFYEDVTFTLTS